MIYTNQKLKFHFPISKREDKLSNDVFEIKYMFSKEVEFRFKAQ